jgi:hypothetical protein
MTMKTIFPSTATGQIQAPAEHEPAMNTSQLPLIALLSLNEEVESTHFRPSRKHPDVTLLPHLNAIQALLQGPTPLAQLVRLEEATDGPRLIDTLRQFGLQLPVHRVPICDTNYEVTFCDVCTLTAADVRRIHRALKKAEAAMPDPIFPTVADKERMNDAPLPAHCTPPGMADVIMRSVANIGASASKADQCNPTCKPHETAWVAELPALLWRYTDLGIVADVGQMGLEELYGIYQFLSRLKDISGIEAKLNEQN